MVEPCPGLAPTLTGLHDPGGPLERGLPGLGTQPDVEMVVVPATLPDFPELADQSPVIEIDDLDFAGLQKHLDEITGPLAGIACMAYVDLVFPVTCEGAQVNVPPLSMRAMGSEPSPLPSTDVSHADARPLRMLLGPSPSYLLDAVDGGGLAPRVGPRAVRASKMIESGTLGGQEFKPTAWWGEGPMGEFLEGNHGMSGSADGPFHSGDIVGRKDRGITGLYGAITPLREQGDHQERHQRGARWGPAVHRTSASMPVQGMARPLWCLAANCDGLHANQISDGDAMLRMRVALFVSALCVFLAPTVASAHCQIPCGIYDDGARVDGLLEDAATIRKAMVQIHALVKGGDALSENQRTRWVLAKDTHAAHVIEVVSQYFLTQKTRVPASGDDAAKRAYRDRLEACHRVLHSAMKTRQTVDEAHVDTLVRGIEKLRTLYVSPR